MSSTQLLSIWKSNGEWQFRGHAGWETRRSSIERLVRACDQHSPLADFAEPLVVQLGDQPSPLGHVAFSRRDDAKQPSSVWPVPDFVFDHWKQVGIDDFERTCDIITRAGQSTPRMSKVGWVGSFATHPIRSVLGQWATDFPHHLAVIDTGAWKASATIDNSARLQTTKQPFMSLADLVAQHAYLIDVEGAGYSGRLKLLMHSGRPLLIQQRPWKEYFFDWMVPYVHYVPVRADLSDLVQQIEWLKTHPQQAHEIAQQALEFAKRYLTRAFALRAWRFVLCRHSEGAGPVLESRAPLSSRLLPTPNRVEFAAIVCALVVMLILMWLLVCILCQLWRFCSSSSSSSSSSSCSPRSLRSSVRTAVEHHPV